MATEAKKIEVGPFVATLVHLDSGWRWWARSGPKGPARDSGEDIAFGLDPAGYVDAGAARRAMRRAQVALAKAARRGSDAHRPEPVLSRMDDPSVDP